MILAVLKAARVELHEASVLLLPTDVARAARVNVLRDRRSRLIHDMLRIDDSLKIQTAVGTTV